MLVPLMWRLNVGSRTLLHASAVVEAAVAARGGVIKSSKASDLLRLGARRLAALRCRHLLRLGPDLARCGVVSEGVGRVACERLQAGLQDTWWAPGRAGVPALCPLHKDCSIARAPTRPPTRAPIGPQLKGPVLDEALGACELLWAEARSSGCANAGS